MTQGPLPLLQAWRSLPFPVRQPLDPTSNHPPAIDPTTEGDDSADAVTSNGGDTNLATTEWIQPLAIVGHVDPTTRNGARW
jgi:hypothetical protein